MTTSLPTPESPPTFEVLSLSRETLEALAAMGYTHPTPVQRAVYDPAVRGLDLRGPGSDRHGQDGSLRVAHHRDGRAATAAKVQVLILCRRASWRCR